MKKPGIESYERFAQAFCQASEEAGKEQYLVPYFITGHPGSTLKDTVELALYLKRERHAPAAGAGLHPHADGRWRRRCTTRASIRSRASPCTRRRDLREKRMKKALLFYWDAQHWPLAREALTQGGPHDLIGRGAHCARSPRGRRPQDRSPARGDGRERGHGRPPRAKTGTRRGP